MTQELNDGRTRLGLGADYELKLTQAQLDPYGAAHFRFRQYHQGLRVLGVGLIAHRDGTSADNTPYLAPGLAMDITPAVPETQARTIAEQAFGAAPGTPLTTLLEGWLIQPIEVFPASRQTPPPAGSTTAIRCSGTPVGYRLVYVAQVSLEEPDAPEAPPEVPPTGEAPSPTPSRAVDAYSLDDTEPQGDSSEVASENTTLAQEPLQVVIDATTGRIVEQGRDQNNAGQPVSSRATRSTTATSKLSTNYDSGSVHYQLYDPDRGVKLGPRSEERHQAQDEYTDSNWSRHNEFGDGVEFEDGDNTSSARGETAAVDVAYGLERTWEAIRNLLQA